MWSSERRHNRLCIKEHILKLPHFFDDCVTATSCTYLLASAMACLRTAEESGPLESGKLLLLTGEVTREQYVLCTLWTIFLCCNGTHEYSKNISTVNFFTFYGTFCISSDDDHTQSFHTGLMNMVSQNALGLSNLAHDHAVQPESQHFFVLNYQNIMWALQFALC